MQLNMTRDSYNQLHFFLPLIFLMAFSCNFYVINAEKLQGMFVFGSSVVDNGNNNDGLGSGNYLPYGIDFPSGPTGRFSNGKNVADQISDLLSLHPVHSFLALQKNNASGLVNGVNFASGASGILEETSILLGVKSLSHQIKNFKHVILPQLEDQLGNSRHNDILSEYLFVLAAGDNDYSYYHILHQNLIWNNLVFAAKLVSSYFGELRTLYNLGARKFLLLSVYPVGCNPFLTKGGNCIQDLNAAVDIFYDQLVLMVMQSKQEMPDAQFCAVNTAKIILESMKFKNTTGFSNVKTPCCETIAEGTCKKGGKTCKNRKEYFYFDGVHLTEAASDIIGNKAFYSRDNSEVYPVNLQRLTNKV